MKNWETARGMARGDVSKKVSHKRGSKVAVQADRQLGGHRLGSRKKIVVREGIVSSRVVRMC